MIQHTQLINYLISKVYLMAKISLAVFKTKKVGHEDSISLQLVLFLLQADPMMS